MFSFSTTWMSELHTTWQTIRLNKKRCFYSFNTNKTQNNTKERQNKTIRNTTNMTTEQISLSWHPHGFKEPLVLMVKGTVSSYNILTHQTQNTKIKKNKWTLVCPNTKTGLRGASRVNGEGMNEFKQHTTWYNTSTQYNCLLTTTAVDPPVLYYYYLCHLCCKW